MRYLTLIKLFKRQISHKLQKCAIENKTNQICSDSISQQIRYKVCRDKETISVNEIIKPSSSEKIEKNEKNEMEENVQKSRVFELSTTYKCITQPLKMSKLASPFPEPVKIMPSHTVSDQEKAEQMQADFRPPMFTKKF